jgi:Amidohydrolase family
MTDKWIFGMRIFPFLFASLLPVAVIAQPSPNQAPDRTWITDVRIISPEKLAHIEKGSVLIENGRIVRVDRKKGAKKPAGATIVSGEGQFLIPGLIDSHVHLASIPGIRPEVNFGPAEAQPLWIKEYFKQLPRSYLYFGYTTLVDLATIDRRVLGDFKQAPLHPDLYDCGESLPFANGYPMSFAPPEARFQLFPNFIYDSNQASSIPAQYRPQDHTPAAAVAAVKGSGGICIKTYFERGFAGDRNLPVMGLDVLADVRKSATQAGLVLMMHANSFEAQKFAVDGHVDVIAHGMWNWGDLDKQTELPTEIEKVLDRIAEEKIGYQPTLQVMHGLRAYFDPEYLKMKAIPKVLPAEMLEWFESPEGKWFKKEIAEDNAPDAAMREGFDDGPVRRVHYQEMQQLQRAGLSLEQIFRAATINNARAFKLDSQLGTIEPGKIANLVLLKKSPLESLEAYDSILTVWIHGRSTSRDSLAANSSK